jgi:hypothetical protein
MGVLKAVLWIILGYLLLKAIGRLLRPWLLAYARKKTGEFFQQASVNRPDTRASNRPVGEVTIDKKPPQRSSSGKKVGEYIEYEEIE